MGSDAPHLLARPILRISRWSTASASILSGFSEEERRDLWGRNANRVYRLGLTL
jgi:predicted TIM-barrel fold metal-dependent hydrolase